MTDFKSEVEYNGMLRFGGGQSAFARKKKTLAYSVSLIYQSLATIKQPKSQKTARNISLKVAHIFGVSIK
jgi:hypothetical protein